MSQPDENSPERLLGICGRCKHWFLVDLIAEDDEGIIAKLPDVQIIRALCHENPREGISVISERQQPSLADPEKAAQAPDSNP